MPAELTVIVTTPDGGSFTDRITTDMSKAFTRENDQDEDEDVGAPPIPAGLKNYITPAGFKRLKDEALHLLATCSELLITCKQLGKALTATHTEC